MTTQAPSPAVAAVLADNHRRFLAFLVRRVPTREVAEDILQDAFVRGITKAPPLGSSESIVAWFYRVLRNAIVDHYRRSGAEGRALERLAREPDGTAGAVEDPELFGEVCACVRALLPTLKPEYAEAIAQVDLEGMPVTRYADAHGITANNAGVRLHRAHRALKRRVQDTCATCAEHGCFQCTCLSGHLAAGAGHAAGAV